MVKATITIDGDDIIADCYAEGVEHFTMVIDRNDFTVKSCSRRQDMYSAHVVWKISEEYRNTGTISDHITSVWF